MSGELNMFVTSVTSSGPHIKFYAQLHTEKYAAMDSMISANQNQFDVVSERVSDCSKVI